MKNGKQSPKRGYSALLFSGKKEKKNNNDTNEEGVRAQPVKKGLGSKSVQVSRPLRQRRKMLAALLSVGFDNDGKFSLKTALHVV